METEFMQPRQEMLCALAGPLGGLSLLFLLRTFPEVAICALVQSVFNLLPVYPFDGGRALLAIIRIRRRKTPCKQTKVIVQ
jgi:Zn-dependent protease